MSPNSGTCGPAPLGPALRNGSAALPLALGMLLPLLLSACSSTGRAGRPSPQAQRQGQGGEYVWVCHGGRSARWQRVSASAADAHRGHGDRVSALPQGEGGSCTR